jgi:hypothetical protein
MLMKVKRILILTKLVLNLYLRMDKKIYLIFSISNKICKILVNSKIKVSLVQKVKKRHKNKKV